MKFATHSLLFSMAFLLLFSACKNDLKLNAPYKEMPSVYAVLNPQDRIQMIRINKVFLGEGNANDMAQVADSINYPNGELTVSLTRFAFGAQDNASPGKREIFFRDSTVQTADGSFNKNQHVYVCSDKLYTNGDYVLTIKNNRTGNVFTAKSTAIDSVRGNQGIRPFTTNPVYPYSTSPPPPLAEYIDYASYDVSVRFAPNEAILYQLVIRLHYYDLDYSSNKTYHYVDFAFGNKTNKDVQSIGNNAYLTYTAKSQDLFEAIGYNLSKANVTTNIQGRKMYKIEFLAYSTTQQYADYLQFIAPSLSISQSKPLYSNFDNRAALGLFTFRSRCSVNKEMSTTFVSAFSSNPSTCSFRFYNSADQLIGCN